MGLIDAILAALVLHAAWQYLLRASPALAAWREARTIDAEWKGADTWTPTR